MTQPLLVIHQIEGQRWLLRPLDSQLGMVLRSATQIPCTSAALEFGYCL
jgi:hypothetical protein